MIELQTLGAVDLRLDGKEVATVLAQPKRLALLAYLATARPRGFQSRDALLALFWPEADDERARNSLRQALHQLRRSLGEAALPGRGEREVGVDPSVVRCDAAQFDDAVERESWEEALRLHRGDFLPGLFVQDAPEVERWLDEERARRRRDAAGAAWRLTDAAEQAGDAVAAERWARLAVGLEPGDEPAIRRLVVLLHRAGDGAGALRAYDDLARRLREDYGLEPSEETERLVREIRDRAAARDAARPAQPHSLPSTVAAMAPVAPAPVAAGEDPSASREPEKRPPRAAPPPMHRRWATIGAAAALLVIVFAGALYARRKSVERDAGRVAEPTIAVLPFVNMSADPANEYLSDGLSEELLNLLAQVPGLQVAARTSSFTFKGRNAPVDSIGRVLRVRHVLEGSVRQAGPRVRITAQLIDASTGYHLWSGTFDSRVDDVVAVQDSIGRVIVELLRPRLAAGRGAPTLAAREPLDAQAHVAVLKGWRAFRTNTREGYDAAAVHFADAVRRDSSYGRAYAGLATVRNWQAYFRYIGQDSGYAEAERLARRAISLDSTLTEAWVILAYVAEARDRDDRAALAHYAKAIALNPNEARAYGRRAQLLVRLGRADDAIASARRAVELDPASPAVHADLAGTYYALGRFAEQERALRSALALDPGHPILLGNLALSLQSQEKYDGAREAIVAARRRAPDDAVLLGKHAFIEARTGHAAAARALLDTAEAAGTPPVGLAATYVLLGDRERAFALLERAVREHDDGVRDLLDPEILPELRGDPRMARLVEQARGIPPR